MAFQFMLRDCTGTCRWQGTADTQEELMAVLADHVRRVHKVETISEAVTGVVKQKLRRITRLSASLALDAHRP